MSLTESEAQHDSGAGSADGLPDVIREACVNATLQNVRFELAEFTGTTFHIAGEELMTIGALFGSDRVSGESPFQNGSDEVVGVGLLLRIGGQLVSASNMLFREGNAYAAAALLRQLVEVEYLAWAFENRNQDAERWLRSSKQERQDFFRPAKLREAAKGEFRGEDYGHHCEFGGHPVPGAIILFRNPENIGQLFLADLLGHSRRIWDHLVRWAASNTWATPLIAKNPDMVSRYTDWKAEDPLSAVPPPPTSDNSE